MPKKILFESAVHQFLWAGRRLREHWQATGRRTEAQRLAEWLRGLELINPGPGSLIVRWYVPTANEHIIPLKGARFYTRGDAEAHARRQGEAGQVFAPDQVMAANRTYFDAQLLEILTKAGAFPLGSSAVAPGDRTADRKHAEEKFHDEWAASEDLTRINVRHRNEAVTAPEMRHIRAALSDLRGRTLLDIGCGLGEASVYFALEGAAVTATDISPGMCAATQRLAALNGTSLETHVSAAEDLGLGDRQFDIIYTGNTLHHADIAVMMDRLLPHLKPTGTFVSWDPVAYNPVINVYRAMAQEVRTEDEHPLRLSDIRAITGRFQHASVSWYWFLANLVFVFLAITKIGRFHQTRMWKTVIDEAARWAWLYRPLAALDRVLLIVLPFLRPLCWNVVIVAHSPRPSPLS